MAVSLETNQLKKIVQNTPLSNTSSQSYATLSRKLNTHMHKSPDFDHESLPMDSQEPSLPNNLNSGHVIPVRDTALTSHEAPDLPTWTPLKTLGDEGDKHGFPLSDPEVDELSTGIIETTDTAIKSPAEQLPSHAQSLTVDHSVVARRISPSVTKSSKRKTTRFDGVLITTSPSRSAKDYSPTRLGRTKRAHTSKPPSLSLVDALARTFNANRHTEDLPHAGSHRHGDAEPIEVLTETDDDQFRLSTRLAYTPLKRRLTRAAASETNSEDASSNFQDVPQPGRPAKRLKPVFYDSNPAAIDAALGTVEAPIIWEDEIYVQVTSPAGTDHDGSPTRMIIDEENHVVNLAWREAYTPPSSTKAGDLPRNTPARGNANGGVFTPYVSRGTKFRQRLEAMFGENATVRKDRAARPRPADLDVFSPLTEVDKELSLDARSESATSVSAASTPEEGASGVSGTHATTQSPNPPASPSVNQSSENQLDEDHLTLPTFDTTEEQMTTWIVALQRLVKGKVRITEQVLEELSIALAEIESVKDNLNTSVPTTLDLFGSLKQVSELHEIPFGDRNRLRQRAKNIVHEWPFMGKPGASSS